MVVNYLIVLNWIAVQERIQQNCSFSSCYRELCIVTHTGCVIVIWSLRWYRWPLILFILHIYLINLCDSCGFNFVLFSIIFLVLLFLHCLNLSIITDELFFCFFYQNLLLQDTADSGTILKVSQGLFLWVLCIYYINYFY